MTWFFKNGELSQDGWDVLVDSSIEGWQHTGLRVGTLCEGRQFHIPADNLERIIFPLGSDCGISCGGGV
jgi:5-deoxy-glucuronate isomerase